MCSMQSCFRSTVVLLLPLFLVLLLLLCFPRWQKFVRCYWCCWCSTPRPTWNGKITSTGNHLEIYRKSEILNELFLGIFRLIFREEILLEQEAVPIGCGEHQPGYRNSTGHQFYHFVRFSKNLAQVSRETYMGKYWKGKRFVGVVCCLALRHVHARAWLTSSKGVWRLQSWQLTTAPPQDQT